MTPSYRERVALVSILLVEMTGRPGWFRALEWMVAISTRRFPNAKVRSFGSRLTVGPLQLGGGAWDRKVAVESALLRLSIHVTEGGFPDSTTLALIWNGPLANVRNPIAYREALDLSFPLSTVILMAAGGGSD